MNQLDDALEELQSYGTNYGPHLFANHAPMVAEALASVGRSEAIASWLEGYIKHLEPAVPASSPVGAETWREALGDPNRFTDWTQFFRREIDNQPWRDVVARWVPRLAPGFAGQLLHGAIRVAHAVRGLAEETPARMEELAGALAYWAIAYWEPGATRTTVPTPRDLVDEGARLYLANREEPIGYAHAVTGPAAAVILADFIDAADREALGRHAAEAVDSIVHRFGGAPAVSGYPDAVNSAVNEVLDVAIANGDEHVIKLVEVCVRDWDDVVLRAAAVDIPTRL